MASPELITDLASLPMVLLVDDILGIYRMGRGTLRRDLALGTFRPRPFAKRPYRWRRADVERHFERLGATPITTTTTTTTGPRRRRRTTRAR